MSKLFIGVKRIIAVDSSEFAYAEVDVDAHCMLVAEGNVGKSSLINAIRLFFLPECSMAKQAVNFGFSDSQGETYDSQTTYNHYFPSKFSFLILEYEKRVFDGPHCCQILSAANNGRLKFERMFTQLPYAQLRHLFWQQGDDPDGIGERVSNLSKHRVYDYIQNNDNSCTLAKDPVKTSALLYESELQLTRYSLFPLKNQEPQTVNSLRALIKLLFVASSKNKKPFTDAIANIIEGSKKSTQDHLHFSISEFKEQHENLKAQELQLTAIVNQTSLFHKLLKHKASFEEYLTALEQVKPCVEWLTSSRESLQLELQELATKNTLAGEKHHKQQRRLTELKEKTALEKRALKEKEKEQRLHQDTIDSFRRLKTEYPGQSIADIKDFLLADLAEKETQLGVQTGNISRAEALAKVDNQINALKNTQTSIQHAIDNQQYDLENQLPKDQLDWLHSINPLLANANSGKPLTQAEQDALTHFAEMFEVQASHYQFFNAKLHFSAYSKINHTAMLEKNQQEIEALEKQARNIQVEQKNVLHAERSLKQLERDIELSKSDMQVIENQPYATRRSDILLSDIDIAQTSTAAYEHSMHAEQRGLDDITIRQFKAKSDYDDCHRRIAENKHYVSQLTSLTNLHSKWLNMLGDNIEFSGYLNDEHIQMFSQCARNLEQLQFELIGGLRNFIDRKIIPDKHGLKGDTPFWPEIVACFQDIDEVYANLDTQRDLLGKQIEEHNQTIGNKKEIIVQNYRVIKSFEKDINLAFTGLTINNVASVEFEVGINKQFETLVNEFAETNLYSNKMQSEDFYVRLVAFAERFFDQDDNFTLTMSQIIESFEPRVKLANKAGKEDKKQSNSTNALIKIKLVQLLLKRLIYHNCETSFPIVHDEIANIDIGQFDWWLADLTENGFNLMAAGTHSTSPELQAKIGRRHVMDALITALPYHSERNRVYWQGAEEFTLNNINEVDNSQEILI
ncbi:MAG: hypothetical protein ACJA0G_001003 [Kangiellaceae bacterium]|jgi:hypothetical protein